MSMDLAVQKFSTEPRYFEEGTGPIAKAVKVAAADIPAQATTTGSGDAAKTTVTTTGIYGLTPDSIRADEEGPVWLTGEFFADSLVLPEGVKPADVETALREIGIFLK